MKISVDLPNEDKAKAAIKKVKGKKPLLTMEEAWAKIFSMKNSAKDKERLKLVKEYLEEGKVSREEDKLNKNFSKAEALRIYQKVQEMEREAKFDEIRKKEWEKFPIINNIVELASWIDNALECDNEYLAMDFETVGDNGGTDMYREEISGFSLTYRYKGEIINGYVPMRHREEDGSPSHLNIANVKWAEEGIKRVFESDKATVWHNATFDMGLAKASLGIAPRTPVHDTLILMHLLDEDLPSYQLKVLATRFLDIPSDTFEEMFGKNAKFADIAVEIARWYAGKDTYVGFLLFEWQLNILNKPSFSKIKKVYERIERPCIMATFEMESEGFHINMEEVEVQRKESEAELEEISARLQARFGDVNFSSPSQLLKLLYVDNDWSKYVTADHKSILRGHVGYDKHGISNNKLFALMPNGSVILDPIVNAEGKVVPKNDRNKLQANAKAMKKIAKAVDEVQDILDYKDLTKHLTAFVNKIDTFIAPDGKLHGQFNQFGTVTGRFSASNPNLQQQPKKARKMFEAPEGSLILGADFSQQEPRLLAHSSGCQELINIYKEGRDLYSEMASAIFNKPIEECLDGSIYRKNTKMIVLAIMYGMGAYSLADILRIDAQEAQKMIDDFFVVYPEVETWIEGNKKTVVKQRYVETLFGMRRRFKHENFNILKKNWNSLDENDKKLRSAAARALRQATNALIQGGAASQTKLVMNAARIRLKELSEARGEPNSFGFLAQVHDELLFKVPEDVTPQEVDAIEDVMINTVKLVVPSKTDIEIGKNWGKMTARKDWFK